MLLNMGQVFWKTEMRWLLYRNTDVSVGIAVPIFRVTTKLSWRRMYKIPTNYVGRDSLAGIANCKGMHNPGSESADPIDREV